MAYGVHKDGSIRQGALETSVQNSIQNPTNVTAAGIDAEASTNGQVLTSDGDGTASWQDAGGEGGPSFQVIVQGDGTATATGTPGGALQRTGSPSSFTITVPAASLVEGAVFRVFATAQGEDPGDELGLKASSAAGPALFAHTGGNIYVADTHLIVSTEGASGALLLGQTSFTHDTGTDLSIFVAGNGFMGNNMTGLLFSIESIG